MEWISNLSGESGFQKTEVTLEMLTYYIENEPILLLREKRQLISAIHMLIKNNCDKREDVSNNSVDVSNRLFDASNNHVINENSKTTNDAQQLAECFIRDGPGSIAVQNIQICTQCHTWKRSNSRNNHKCPLVIHGYIHNPFHKWSLSNYRVVYSKIELASFSTHPDIPCNLDILDMEKADGLDINTGTILGDCKLCGTPYVMK